MVREDTHRKETKNIAEKQRNTEIETTENRGKYEEKYTERYSERQ